MLKSFITSIVLLLSSHLYCQDSVTVVVKGKVMDTVQNIPVAEVGIISMANLEKTYQSISDSLGRYSILYRLPIGENFITIQPLNDRRGSFGNYFEFQVSSDSIIQKDIQLTPVRMCYDSFLPSTLLFEKNQTKPSQDSLRDTQTLLQYAASLSQYIFEKRVIEISVYCSYGEKRSIAKQRAEEMKRMAIEAGITIENLRMNIFGKEEMFICQYCDGCHYEFLHGQGYTLSKDQFDEITDPNKKEEHLAQRRAVMFKWAER